MPFSFDFEPPEVHLERAPIVRTLCQIRFSAVPELVDDESERKLAEVLKEQYPVRGWVEGMAIPFTGGESIRPEKFRTFEDADGIWKVTVSPDFLALETQGYGSRRDFVKRIRVAIEAVLAVQQPPKVTRIGLRYTNRIDEPEGIAELVNPALLGWIPEVSDHSILRHQVIQTMLNHPVDDSKVLVQSLFLPPMAIFDPTIKAIDRQSWVLDIDTFNERARRFEKDSLADQVESLAVHAYQVFYWSVNETFRQNYRD